MQEVEALIIGEERVGAVFEKQVDDVVVASFRSPEDWCSNSIAALRVDVGAALDKEMAERIVVVNCGPLRIGSAAVVGRHCVC